MSINRSSRYQEIHDRVWDQYMTPPENDRDEHWWRKYAPKWRNRVGLPRLVAEEAVLEASSLLRSLNPGLFRNDPDMQLLFGAALNAAEEFARELARQNWERFEGKEDR